MGRHNHKYEIYKKQNGVKEIIGYCKNYQECYNLLNISIDSIKKLVHNRYTLYNEKFEIKKVKYIYIK